MEYIQDKTFDEERALYGSKHLTLENVRFDGPADGESALKECKDIVAKNCFCNLRYPFWHVDGLTIENSELTTLCRASIWYSKDIHIKGTKMHGIKALRECKDAHIEDCDIDSPEFGWSVKGVEMSNTTAKSEYFMMRSSNIKFKNVKFTGKYSFQYIKDAEFDNCEFNTKDAFWHGKNIVVRNSVVKGEYLAWYSQNLTFENCTIVGTQPLCYCKDLRLINCKMIDTDLCFEKSDVYAEITTPVMSVKNPRSGKIILPSVDEIIKDDKFAKGEIILLNM